MPSESLTFVIFIIIGRAFHALAGGIFCMIIPIICSFFPLLLFNILVRELSPVEISGSLGSVHQLMVSIPLTISNNYNIFIDHPWKAYCLFIFLFEE